MSVLNREMLNNQEMQRRAENAFQDIGAVLRAQKVPSGRDDVRIILAAYLLYEASTYNNPTDYQYEQLVKENFKVDPDLNLAIREMISGQEWENLLTLTRRYSTEEFAMAAMKNDLFFMGRVNGEMTTPDSIVRLAQRILQIEQGEKVADLCCGYGSFLSRIAMDEPLADYCGYEINSLSKIVASIRTSLVNEHIKVKLRDVFDLPGEEPGLSFDKIFSNYPFMIPLKNNEASEKFTKQILNKYPGLSRIKSSDWVFNALLCELLADSGKAIGIMTNGSTWNTMDIPVRKLFVENGLVEAVISLPAKMFSSTAIATSLIVLSKGNSSVRLVDATGICQQGRRYNEFSKKNIDDILHALQNDCEYSRMLSTDELRENDYTLSLSRYRRESIPFRDAVPFGDVIKSITRGAQCTADQLDEMSTNKVTGIQYLMLANIQDGIIDNELPYLSALEPRLNKYCLKDNDLILSKNGYPYKVAVAQIHKGQKILANGNMYIIELDQEKVDPYYLKAFFESEKGIAVLKSITVGAAIPNIGVDKLKNVKVPIPSLEEQKRISERYQAQSDAIKILRIKLEKSLAHLHHIFDEEMEG